jgi:large subunit ribosomal protein L25
MKFELTAQKRTLQGTGASRRLRRANKVPAIVYGGTAAPMSIELDHNQILLSLKKEAFHSSVLTLNIDGATETVLLRDSQVHPYKALVLHCDFLRVDTTHEIHQKVPLHFINAELAPGVKVAGGNISHVLGEIEVSCLPQDLPAFIEVDLKDLAVGDAFHVSQLVLPAGVKLLAHGDDGVVALIQLKKGGGEEEEAVAEVAATPAAPAAPAA